MSQADAFAEGLVTQQDGKPMYMGVDYNTTLSTSGPGRKSVRLTSKKSWTHGLFIADILHSRSYSNRALLLEVGSGTTRYVFH
jgi:hypothetical protein